MSEGSQDAVAGALPGGMFPETRWTLVEQAGQTRPTFAREALDTLIRQYEPALLKYLRSVWRLSRDEAEEVLQGFLAEKVIRSRLIAHADQRRGQFRTFLKTVLSNYLRSEMRRAGAKKRTPDRAVLEPALLDGVGKSPEVDLFDVEWARALLQQALDRLHADCLESGREDLWDLFSSRLLNPLLFNQEPPRYEDLIVQMNLTSPSQVWNLLTKAKQMFIGHLKDAIATYARDEAELEEEVNDLFKILSQARE